MSRAYTVYFLTFAVLVAAMALILTAGDAVEAPDDLSGEWVMEWDNAPPPESGEPVLHIAQSGRYFVVRFGNAPPLNMTLEDGWKGKSHGRRLDMTLARPRWTLHLSGNIPPRRDFRIPEVKLELRGPTRHYGIARRVDPSEAGLTSAQPVAPPLAASPPAEARTAAGTPTADAPEAEALDAR